MCLRPHRAGSTIPCLRPTGSSLGIAPVDYDPVVLLKPFGPRLAAGARPSRASWGAVTIPSTSSHTVGEEARQLVQGRGPEIDRQWHRNPGKVEGVVTETVDVLGVVVTQPGRVANSGVGRRMGCARPQFHTLLTS